MCPRQAVPLVLETGDLPAPGVAPVQSPNRLTFLVVRIPWLLSGSVVMVKWSPLSPPTMRYVARHAGELGASRSVTVSLCTSWLTAFSGTWVSYCQRGKHSTFRAERLTPPRGGSPLFTGYESSTQLQGSPKPLTLSGTCTDAERPRSQLHSLLGQTHRSDPGLFSLHPMA